MRSYLLLCTADEGLVRTCLLNYPEIVNWMRPFPDAFVVVSDKSASRLRQVIHGVFPNDRLLIVEIQPGHKDGWLPREVWDFINNPKPAKTPG